jgi:hypothetical protein
LLGAPDLGLLTLSEMVARGRAIAAAVDVHDRRRGHRLRQRQQRRADRCRVRAIRVAAAPSKTRSAEEMWGDVGAGTGLKEEHAEKIAAAVRARRSPDF